MFATRFPPGTIAGDKPRDTHDAGKWDTSMFAAFDAKRARATVTPLFGELGLTPFPTVQFALSDFWPLSCLKALEHTLPHRAMLLAAAGRPFAGMLDTPADHRGWCYNATNGNLWANSSKNQAIALPTENTF